MNKWKLNFKKAENQMNSGSLCWYYKNRRQVSGTNRVAFCPAFPKKAASLMVCR